MRGIRGVVTVAACALSVAGCESSSVSTSGTTAKPAVATAARPAAVTPPADLGASVYDHCRGRPGRPVAEKPLIAATKDRVRLFTNTRQVRPGDPLAFTIANGHAKLINYGQAYRLDRRTADRWQRAGGSKAVRDIGYVVPRGGVGGCAFAHIPTDQAPGRYRLTATYSIGPQVDAARQVSALFRVSGPPRPNSALEKAEALSRTPLSLILFSNPAAKRRFEERTARLNDRAAVQQRRWLARGG